MRQFLSATRTCIGVKVISELEVAVRAFRFGHFAPCFFLPALGHGVQRQAKAERLLPWTAGITSSRTPKDTFPEIRERVR